MVSFPTRGEFKLIVPAASKHVILLEIAKCEKTSAEEDLKLPSVALIRESGLSKQMSLPVKIFLWT